MLAEVSLPLQRQRGDGARAGAADPGGRYAPEFAVEVAIGKYLDHPPLERQVRIMEREGLEVSSQTLWDQIDALARHLEPCYAALRPRVLAAPVVYADETHWRLMGQEEETSRWWVWCVANDEAVFYQLLGTRSAKAAGWCCRVTAGSSSAMGTERTKPWRGPDRRSSWPTAGRMCDENSSKSSRTHSGVAVELAARTAAPTPAPSPLQDLAPGRPVLRSRLVARVVADLPLDQTFTASGLAAEVNRRYGPALRKPADARLASAALRRLLAKGVIRLAQKGAARREALYARVSTEGGGSPLGRRSG